MPRVIAALEWSSGKIRKGPAEELAICRVTTIAIAATAASFTGAWLLAPPVTEMPTAPPERLAFAALCWAALARGYLRSACRSTQREAGDQGGVPAEHLGTDGPGWRLLLRSGGGCRLAWFCAFASRRNAVRVWTDLFLQGVRPGCAEAVSGHAAERTGVSGCRVSRSFRRVRTRSFFGRLQYPILYKGNSTVRDFLVCYRRATRHRPDIRYRQGLRESRPKFCFGASWRTYREWLSGPQWMLHARPATHSIGLPRSSFFRYS